MLRIFFVIPFLIIGTITNTFSQDILSLEEAIRIGLENNFAIKIAQKDLEILNRDVTIGNAGFLPSIQAQASRTTTIEDSDILFFDGRTQSVSNAQTDVSNANVVLDWTIFNGMGMFITLERLNEFKRAGQVNARIAVENTVANIYNSYFLIVVEKERLRVLENSLEVSEVRLRIAKDLYEVGRTSKSEYLAAQVDINADMSALLQQQEVLSNAKIDLNLLLGRDLQIDYTVLDEIFVENNLQLQELSERLIMSNANLQFAKHNRNIADLQMRELRAQRSPELRVVGGYRINRSVAEAGFALQNQASGFNYGVVASFNIFNGFNQNRQIQNARIMMETSELQLKDLELQLQTELQKSYTSYTNNLKILDLENTNLGLARENAAIALDRFKLGRSTALELREAQRNEIDAESRTINASYLVKVAEIELLRLSGNLLK